MKIDKNKLLFLLLFSIIGFIALQIPFTKLVGPNVSFTLFDFIAPVAGAFIGSFWGVLTVLTVEVVNLTLQNAPINTGSIIRLFPMLFAIYYFSTFSQKKNQNKIVLLIPAVAILVFVANPVGRSVWYFSLFWLVPLLAYFKRNNLLIRSLGATFTAHAVGGAAWIWAFQLPAAVWKGLVPIVIQERLLFAGGIAVSYLVLNRVFAYLVSKKLLPKTGITLSY